MLEAGFLSKSDVNREFRRVTGLSPTGWRAARADAMPSAVIAATDALRYRVDPAGEGEGRS